MPKIVDHDARRSDILSQSFQLFAERGYSSLTMRELAQSLSISTGTLYHYFDNKRALFQQMFDWIAAQDAAAASLEVPKGVARETRGLMLKAFLLARAEHLTRVIRLAVDFQHHHTPEESQETFQGLLSTYVQAISSQMGITEAHKAQLVLSLIIGVLQHHSFDPSHAPLDLKFERLIALCMDGGLF